MSQQAPVEFRRTLRVLRNDETGQQVLMTGGLTLPELLPRPRAGIQRKAIRPRALMTERERSEYRRAVRATPSLEARLQIREVTYARLRQRAWERGMVLVEPGPRWSGMQWSEGNQVDPAAGAGEGRHLETHPALHPPRYP